VSDLHLNLELIGDFRVGTRSRARLDGGEASPSNHRLATNLLVGS